jgi:pyruvate/2-oxoglutarate dehydrogenase complex dihydrolipoamide acyltransferase (E2) component
MQLKPITAILVLVLVVASLLASGCTSNTSSPTPTPTPTVTATASAKATAKATASAKATAKATASAKATPTATPDSNTLSAWNNAFSKAGYEIVTPFKQNLRTISGTVNDGGDKLKPYKYDISITEVATRDEAKAAYNAAITKAQQQGYNPGSGLDSDRSWSGYLGNQGFQSDKIANIHIEEPDTLWTLLWEPYVIVPGPHTMYYVETTYSTANS